MQKSNLVLQDIVNHAMKKLGVANYGGAMHLMMYPTHLSEAVKELIPNHSPDNIVNRILQGDYGPSTLCSEVLSDFNAPNAPNQHSVASISRDLALKLAHFGKAYDFAGGTIYAGYVDSPNETRFNSIMSKSKPPLIILTEGEKITGFFPINPKDKNNRDYADFSSRFNLDQINESKQAQPKGIRLLNTHLLPTDGNLGKDLVELAKRYYPDGDLEIGSKSSYDAIRFTGYYPDNKEFAPIEIASRCEVIGDVTTSYKHQDNPKARAFIDAFNKAKKKLQAPKKPVAPQAPVKPASTLPVLNRSEFNNLDLPKSAIAYATGAATNKNKVHITVKYAITHETSTHYIVLTAGVGFKHRLQGKSADELVSKLGDFIGISNLNASPVRQGSYIVANVQQIAEYLAKVATIK